MTAMRRLTIRVAATAAVLFTLAAAMPAHAGYGAIAYDQNAGKEGASWNQPTPSKADELALRQCNSKDCRVHPVEAKGCGALARSDKDRAWGGADRMTLARAEHDAIALCRKHAKAGACTVRVSGCNK